MYSLNYYYSKYYNLRRLTSRLILGCSINKVLMSVSSNLCENDSSGGFSMRVIDCEYCRAAKNLLNFFLGRPRSKKINFFNKNKRYAYCSELGQMGLGFFFQDRKNEVGRNFFFGIPKIGIFGVFFKKFFLIQNFRKKSRKLTGSGPGFPISENPGPEGKMC